MGIWQESMFRKATMTRSVGLRRRRNNFEQLKHYTINCFFACHAIYICEILVYFRYIHGRLLSNWMSRNDSREDEVQTGSVESLNCYHWCPRDLRANLITWPNQSLVLCSSRRSSRCSSNSTHSCHHLSTTIHLSISMTHLAISIHVPHPHTFLRVFLVRGSFLRTVDEDFGCCILGLGKGSLIQSV